VIIISYSSREVIKLLKKHGYEQVGVHGSHHYFKHKVTNKKIPVPHPKKDFIMQF
jgi:predicted RNA binding protein YcfA (HicA-like mRNA interferase family)